MAPFESSAQRVRVLGDLVDRSGLFSSPHGERAGAFGLLGSESELDELRDALLRDREPIGTIPRPSSLGDAARQAVDARKGSRPLVLLDKLGERLAFERTGTRLYETLLAKHARNGGFEGGPSRADLESICAEELEHVRTLVGFVDQLGGDPTVATPSADLAAAASMGIVQVVTDPRTSFDESLEAIRIAELVDHDCWKNLVELAREAGQNELCRFAQRAEDEEGRHLANVRRWVKARAAHGEQD